MQEVALKVLKQKKSNEKKGAKAKKMRAAKRKKRRGQKNKTEDGKFKETKNQNLILNLKKTINWYNSKKI